MNYFAYEAWADLLAPAIKACRAGLPVDCDTAADPGGIRPKDLAPFPASAETFLDEDGYPNPRWWTALGETTCET